MLRQRQLAELQKRHVDLVSKSDSDGCHSYAQCDDGRVYMVNLEERYESLQKAVVDAKKDHAKLEGYSKEFLSGVVALLKLESERLAKIRSTMDEDLASLC